MKRIIITPEVHKQINYYVQKSTIEISGLGRVQRMSDGTLVVTKVYLLEQENTSTSTDLDEGAVSKLMYESREDAGHLNFWWHSHVDMPAFWSGTDMATIEQFGKNGWLLSTVFNKKGEYRTAYYQGENEFTPKVWIDGIQTDFVSVPTKEETERWDKEMQEKCKRPAYTGRYYGSNYDYNQGGHPDRWGKDGGSTPTTSTTRSTSASGITDQGKPEGAKNVRGDLVVVGSANEAGGEFSGRYSAMDAATLLESFEDMFQGTTAEKFTKWNLLSVYEGMVVYDLYEIYFKREAVDETDVIVFYEEVCSSDSLYGKVHMAVSDLLTVVDDEEDEVDDPPIVEVEMSTDESYRRYLKDTCGLTNAQINRVMERPKDQRPIARAEYMKINTWRAKGFTAHQIDTLLAEPDEDAQSELAGLFGHLNREQAT